MRGDKDIFRWWTTKVFGHRHVRPISHHTNERQDCNVHAYLCANLIILIPNINIRKYAIKYDTHDLQLR